MRCWRDSAPGSTRFAKRARRRPTEPVAAPSTGRGRGERAASELGLVDLVREFTALRHEVKLQTKSGRGLEEQTAAAIAAMEEAGRQFRAVEPQEAEAARRAALPLIESMADLDEALGGPRPWWSRPAGGSAKSQAAFLRQLADLDAAQPAWKRWLCRSWYAAPRNLCQADAEDRKRVVDALAEGYAMVRKRLERAMAKEGLYRMASVGLPVDPHAMTVVEVVDGDGHAPGTVVEEIRPGYRWNDKVVRFAEVRAARNMNQNP